MSDVDLSRAAAEAVRFLSGLHEDLHALLTALEGAMDRAGWKPVHWPISDLKLRATMKDEWLLSWGYRFYVPASVGDTTTRVVQAVWSFNPPSTKEFDYAALAVAAARFATPVTPKAIYDSWTATLPVTLIGLKRGHVSILDKQDYQSLFPNAAVVAAVAAPLFSFTGEADLRARIVEPILAAEAGLGAAP